MNPSRRPHPRLHAGVRRPVRQLPAGAARRRRHQDRAPGRGRHAPRPAQQGLVGAQPVDRVGWRINANKRNLALDLTKPKSIEIVQRLAAKADVVMENFRPGVMDKLGIGYEALSAINPKLIYCAMSGFGQNGPERTTAAYDGKIQAMSGIMSVTGHPETGPTRAGFAVCDAIGGMTAAFAVSSALFQRTHTGRGQLVDVAMLDATLSFLTSYVTDYTDRRPRAGPARQPGAEPAADRRRVQGARAATSCWPSTTRSSSAPWPGRSAGRTCRRTRASSTGRRGSPTRRRCAPSSRTSSPRPTTRPGKRG